MIDNAQFKWRKWMFLTVFTYTLLLGLFVQLIFLPHIAPFMHMGEGILSGNGDAQTFHYYAKELAELIREEGWSHWEWRAGSAGISSQTAIMYVFFGPHFWLMMPYNALVHALSAVVLFELYRSVLPQVSPRLCCLATLPYLLFPTAMMWTTQLHKDGLFILSIFMFFWGIVQVLRFVESPRSWLYALRILGICMAAIFFMWWFRKDRLALIEIFLGICLIPAVFSWVRSRQLFNRGELLRVCLILLVLIGGWLFLEWNVRPVITRGIQSEEEQSRVKQENPHLLAWSIEKWQPVAWLPAAVDAQFAHMTEIRNNYFVIHHTGHSTIDPDRSFTSSWDVIRYVPRMLQLSYFAPFPQDWLDKGSTKSLSIMRLIVSMETVLVYLSFIGMLYFIKRNWRNPSLWYLLFMITTFMMIYSFVFPNLGTFYRQRFGFLSIVTGFGFIGLVELFLKQREKRLTLRMGSGESALDSE